MNDPFQGLTAGFHAVIFLSNTGVTIEKIKDYRLTAGFHAVIFLRYG